MDSEPGFLRPGSVIRQAPPGATVFFKHVDVRFHWSGHPVTNAWEHRSPDDRWPPPGGQRL